MRFLPAGPAVLEPSELDPGDLVLTLRGADGTGTKGIWWPARSTSHAVTCDYLIGRGLRICSCRAAQVMCG